MVVRESLSSSEASPLLVVSYCRLCQPQLEKKRPEPGGMPEEKHTFFVVIHTRFVPGSDPLQLCDFSHYFPL